RSGSVRNSVRRLASTCRRIADHGAGYREHAAGAAEDLRGGARPQARHRRRRMRHLRRALPGPRGGPQWSRRRAARRPVHSRLSTASGDDPRRSVALSQSDCAGVKDAAVSGSRSVTSGEEGVSTLRVGADEILYRSASMRSVMATVNLIAQSDVSVLLLGESGSGEEVIARAIHELSARSEGMFVPINCASLSGDILENELFGHERGAFTSADEQKRGLFELADGGTVL